MSDVPDRAPEPDPNRNAVQAWTVTEELPPPDLEDGHGGEDEEGPDGGES